jgi:hypothetical protein
MDQRTVRNLAAAVGVVTTVFGIVPMVSPRGFARLFGFDPPKEPTVSAAFRSVGARDLALGMGLWSAAVHGGNIAPWLLARAICDAGDTIAGVLAIRAGARDPRFVGLITMAAGAAGVGWWLWREAKGSVSPSPTAARGREIER